MSSHAASMAARRAICVCGWWLHTFNLGVKEWIVGWEKISFRILLWVASQCLMMEWWKLDPSLAQGRGVLKCDKMLALYCLVIETCFSTLFSEIAAPIVMFPLLQASNIKIIKIRTTHLSSASSASFSVPPPSLTPLPFHLLPSCWPHLIP